MARGTAASVVCKTPGVGGGKSRLRPLLGAEMAQRLSACFIRDVAAALEALPEALGRQLYALFRPAGSEAFLRVLLPSPWTLVPRHEVSVGTVLQTSMAAYRRRIGTSKISGTLSVTIRAGCESLVDRSRTRNLAEGFDSGRRRPRAAQAAGREQRSRRLHLRQPPGGQARIDAEHVEVDVAAIGLPPIEAADMLGRRRGDVGHGTRI